MHTRRSKRSRKWLSLALLATLGCNHVQPFSFKDSWEQAPTRYTPVSTQIEYPNVASNLDPIVVSTPRPIMLENPADLVTRDLELQEAIRTALNNSEILRNLGGSIVQAPNALGTTFDPALTESNPLGGVEAALSAFDARVTSQLFWQYNNVPNNVSFGDPVLQLFNVRALEQTRAVFNYDISKRTATGATFAARHNIAYDNSNQPNRLFTGAYNGFFEGEWRQPLLQGGGVEFNRIAGPGSQVGQYNGVLIARINTDISLADFESGVIQFINDVETAYWELHFAYHNLESQVAGRNSSLLTWQRIRELQKVGVRGGDAAAEAQSRSQYYAFEVQVKEALVGSNGLYETEQRLRYLLGLPATDGQLLKPTSEPMQGEVIYDWEGALRDALNQRVEVRRQKWDVKRRELELVAARLNRRPTLDFLAQYRYRGLGDALIDSRDPNNSFNSLYQNIFEGDYQEWQAGVELGYPVGLRQAGAAVANARWNLARSQAVLEEQELRISHDLSSAARRIERSFALMQINYNRQVSDQDQVEALQARYESGLDNINFLLQAQQQLAASQSAYFRSLIDYQLALRDFHREKGSLLNYNLVGLSEGAWPAAATRDAAERGRFFVPRLNPEKVDVPRPVSSGAFDPSMVGANQTLPSGLFEEAIVAEPISPPESDE